MNDNQRQRSMVERARLFAEEEIRPYATEFDVNGGLPRSLIGKLAQEKFLSASFPGKYDGLDLDPVYYGLLTEQIGKACCSTRSLLTVETSLIGETFLRWGTEEQKNRWLPLIANGEKIGAFALSEPFVGSDAKAVQTAYDRSGNDYIINGKKDWISFGGVADFFIVIAACDGQVSAFIVEREMGKVSSSPIMGLLAQRATYLSQIEFNGVMVSKDNVLGQPGSGFPFIVSAALDNGRYSVAWGGVAVAQEAVEAMTRYARERSQFGTRIYNFQLIQGMIADAVTDIHAARALCLKAGRMRREGNPDAIAETSMAKYFASKVAMEVTKNALQIHGGNGCHNKFPAERLFREAKVLEIIEGTSQIQQQIIAKYGLRKYSQNFHRTADWQQGL